MDKKNRLAGAAKVTSLIFFFGALLFFAVMTLLSPKESYSQTENRVLAEAPEFSFESYLNESFMKETESYLADSFFLRSNLIASKTTFERLLGKTEIGGVLLVKNRMMLPFPEVDDNILSQNIEAVSSLAEYSQVPVYAMLVPTAAGIYGEELPKNYKNADQKALIDSIYERLSQKVTVLNVYYPLYSARDDYIYYKTDHHWTALGAFYAYESTVSSMGFKPVRLSSYSIEHVSDGFLGTLYAKAPTNRYGSDTIDAFRVKNGFNITGVTVNGEQYDSMYFYDKLNILNKYGFYLGSATSPVTTITSDCTNGKRLLIIKDSYAQCLAPFYTQHYSEITMVDLRTFATAGIRSALQLDSFDAVLIVYNLADFVQDSNIVKLSF